MRRGRRTRSRMRGMMRKMRRSRRRMRRRRRRRGSHALLLDSAECLSDQWRWGKGGDSETVVRPTLCYVMPCVQSEPHNAMPCAWLGGVLCHARNVNMQCYVIA
eukprot:705176-Pyramimonas_sp.AAC.1